MFSISKIKKRFWIIHWPINGNVTQYVSVRSHAIQNQWHLWWIIYDAVLIYECFLIFVLFFFCSSFWCSFDKNKLLFSDVWIILNIKYAYKNIFMVMKLYVFAINTIKKINNKKTEGNNKTWIEPHYYCFHFYCIPCKRVLITVIKSVYEINSMKYS